jgi:predicted Zn-dependent peptidase
MKHSVSEHHLAGGASGLVIDVPGSDVVSIQIRFNSGFQFANPDMYEVPHVMEHVLATVTKRHPGPNQFIIDAQKNGAYVNASTSVDSNGYIYECADFELDRILDLVEEQLAEPLFEPKSLKAEIGNVREELTRNTTQHATVCSVRLAEKAYPNLWLDYDARIAQLDGIGVEHIEKHYHGTHTSANSRFVIAGSFPDGGAKLAQRLDKIFGRLPVGERRPRSLEIGRNLKEPVVTKRDIQQLYYRVVMYFGELTEPERRAMTLLRLVLVGGMGARILGEARRRGLAYGVGGAGHAEPGNSSFGFLGYVTPTNAEALFELMAREFGAVRAGELKESELEAAKDLLIGSLKRSTQTPGDILGWYLEPYDESGEIRDFGRTMDLLRGVRLDEVVALARKASAGQRRGLSFLGRVDKALSSRYSELLEPLWQV